MSPSRSKPLVLVVGASGRLGRVVIDALLDRGDRVRAFSRHAGAIVAREGLECVVGDVLDHDRIDAAVSGVDAVVCVIGPTRSSEHDLCSRGTERIVRAMHEHHVQRLVCVTGAMIGHPFEHLGFVYRFLASHVPAAQMEDRRRQETVVIESGLAWTLVRPTRLTDGASAPQLVAGDDVPIGALAHVSRSDVARFIVDALASPDTIARSYALVASETPAVDVASEGGRPLPDV